MREQPETEKADNSDDLDGDGDLIRRPIGQLETVVLFYCGLVAPVFAHLFLVPTLTGDIRYQTGLLRDQYGFVLTFGALIWMYPLILFSLASFCATVLDLDHTGREFWARLGLSTSIPIGVLYHIAVVVRFGLEPAWLIGYHLAPLAIWLLGWGYVKFIIWVTPNRRAAWLYGLTILFGGLTLITTLVVIGTRERSYFSLLVIPFLLFFWGSLIYSPLLMLSSHGWLIARVHTRHSSARRLSLRWLMSWVTWLGCLFAACRYAVSTSLDEYSRLPLQDPGSCFVATAACRGHRRLVGSREVARGYWLSPQLQRLKAFEIAMQALLPGFHRVIRQLYNTFGPVMARRVTSRWAGDCCYLLLKPAECIAVICLFLLLRIDVRLIERLYCGRD
ncbi:MAG: DUF6688 family protein [Planctomycetota bacterium]